jgi:hypothetical protein
LTPAQIDTLKRIEAEMKASGDWLVVEKDEWPDEANAALRSMCRRVEQLQRRVTCLEQIINDNVDPTECDAIDAMIVEQVKRRVASRISSSSTRTEP